MTDYRIVLVTCENSAQAERIAETVVVERLAACVNIMPGIRSCYIWEGRKTWSDETLLFVKTTSGRFAELRDRILALHTYSTPEIVAVPIADGLSGYLGWIDESVGAGS
jgi:periplasmic divalent cation tolerance protein